MGSLQTTGIQVELKLYYVVFSVSAWPVIGKPMKVVQTSQNKLSNR